MSTVILYLWLATAAARYDFHYAWVPSGEFAGIHACESAIKALGLKPERARCIDTNRATQAAKGEAKQ